MKKISCLLAACSIFALIPSFVAPAPAFAEDGIAISKDGVAISYSVYGEGETTLVFVHGWSCNKSIWQNQVPYFAKNYRVVTLDLAGHGTSGTIREIYTLKAFGEDVAAVIKASKAHKVILIGHSMAGAVIIETAGMIPDDIAALVGIDTRQDFEEEFTPEQITEFIAPFKEDFREATDSFVREMFIESTPPELMEKVVGMMTKASARVGISALEEMMKTSYVAHPPKIKAPVWCLNSNLWPTKPKVNSKYVPEFNLHVMQDVGHFLMLEAPEKFNQRLSAILDEIRERTSADNKP